MSKERRPGAEGQAFLTAGELAFGSAGFISGIISAGDIISGGEQYLMDVVDKVWQYDIFGLLLHVTTEAEIPVQVTIAAIITASAALVVDGVRRKEWATNYFDQK